MTKEKKMTKVFMSWEEVMKALDVEVMTNLYGMCDENE